MRAFINGTFETLEGPIVERGALLADDAGKIVDVVRGDEVPSDAETIDLGGGYVTPGLVDAHTHLGNFTYSTPAGMIDGNEKTDPVTPQLRALDAFYPDDEALPEALAGGVTTVQCLPGSANVIGGTGIVLKLRGRVVDKMVIKSPSAMKAALGENPKRVYGEERKKAPLTRMVVASLLRETLAKAQDYAKKTESKTPHDRDLGLEALQPVLERRMPLTIHCHRSDDICTAIRIAEEFGLRYTLEHCTEGHLIADYLAEKGVKAALGPSFSGKSKLELKNRSWETPAALYRAGVQFCLITDHPFMLLSEYPLAAVIACKAGLPRIEALKGITLYGARHLELDGRIGSLKKGKDADLAVWSGDPMDLRNVCLMTVIDGQVVYRRDER